MGREHDPEADLVADIQRFPERYPKSVGGLRPNDAPHKDYGDQATSTIHPLDSANIEPLDGVEDDERWPEDDHGVHACDDGQDTFEPNDYDE